MCVLERCAMLKGWFENPQVLILLPFVKHIVFERNIIFAWKEKWYPFEH
jgi:hypothetical protein